jgi:hypothetical protein
MTVVRDSRSRLTSANSTPPADERGAEGLLARDFTLAELALPDAAVPGRPVLVAYRGRVYDVRVV